MVKVLISDKLSPRAKEILESRGIEADQITGLKPDELAAKIGEYDGLAVRSNTKVTKEIMAAAKNLKVIGRAGIGVDNVDVPAATAAGVVVMNTPFGNSITTAEHAVAMMMALAREIPQAHASTRAGKWEKSRFMGVELMSKTLGIIGCGNIGSVVADRAIGLKMKVVAYDPFLSPDRAVDLGVEKVELDDLFRRADFISLHTPLLDATRGILNKDAFAKMRDGVRIINCARGGLVDEADLKVALDAGKVAGAALDVFENEPAHENPLFDDERVIVTPHLGASTTEAQVNVAVQIAEQMADYLLDGAVSNALNMASVTAEEAPKLRPYMKLAAQLGSFAGQLTESRITKVTIEYEGEVADLNVRPLTAIVLEGLLKPLMDSVNMVNAPGLARERDIEVAEVKLDREGDYHTLVRLTVTTEKQERSLAGTLFSDGGARLVEVKGINIEAQLCEHMLYTVNDDLPGFIGNLGSVLGNAGLNIATFNLGRAAAGKEAIALVALDQAVADGVLKEVRALPHVKQAKVLRF